MVSYCNIDWMGTCIEVCIGWTILGCFECCLQELSECCGNLIGRERLAKILYVVLQFMVVVPALFIFYYIQHWQWFVQYFSNWIYCPEDEQGNLNCFGTSTVYRLSMALLILFLVLTVVMICRNKLSKAINEGLFLLKYIIVITIFVALLFVKSDVFEAYAMACRVIGLIFLTIQSIILIDLFYLWGIHWIIKYSEGKGIYAVLLISFSVLLYGGALTINIFSYVNFNYCEIWTTVITSVLLVAIPCTQLLHFNVQNSLLTTSVLCLYLSYLNFMALYSNPSCHALSEGAMTADIFTSCILFFLTMFGSITGGSGVIKVDAQRSINETLGVVMSEKSEDGDHYRKDLMDSSNIALQSQEAALSDDYQNWAWVKWHLYMCIGSMYISDMVTNWGSPEVNSPSIGAYNPNHFAYWSKLSVEWVTSLLYLWTLVAPKIFPNRDFVIV